MWPREVTSPDCTPQWPGAREGLRRELGFQKVLPGGPAVLPALSWLLGVLPWGRGPESSAHRLPTWGPASSHSSLSAGQQALPGIWNWVLGIWSHGWALAGGRNGWTWGGPHGGGYDSRGAPGERPLLPTPGSRRLPCAPGCTLVAAAAPTRPCTGRWREDPS